LQQFGKDIYQPVLPGTACPPNHHKEEEVTEVFVLTEVTLSITATYFTEISCLSLLGTKT